MIVHVTSKLVPKLTVFVEVMVSAESPCASTSISVGGGDKAFVAIVGVVITEIEGSVTRSNMSNLSTSLSLVEERAVNSAYMSWFEGHAGLTSRPCLRSYKLVSIGYAV